MREKPMEKRENGVRVEHLTGPDRGGFGSTGK